MQLVGKALDPVPGYAPSSLPATHSGPPAVTGSGDESVKGPRHDGAVVHAVTSMHVPLQSDEWLAGAEHIDDGQELHIGALCHCAGP